LDRTLPGTIVLLAMLLPLLGTTTVHGSRPPLQPDSFAIYNYTRIDRGINGSYSCSTYLVLWVFSSNGSKIVYGVRAARNDSTAYTGLERLFSFVLFENHFHVFMLIL